MFQFIKRYQSRLYPLYAVADQALQSLINLLSNILIIRFASKMEYGIYGIGFASLLLMMGLSHALIGLQMTVIAPDKPEEERRAYFGSMFVAMAALVGLLVTLALLGTVLAGKWIPGEYRSLTMVVALAAPGFLVMQFMRQSHYFFNMAGRVLLFDTVFFILYFGGLISLIYFKVKDFHLWALALNGGIALVIGLAAVLLSARLTIIQSASSAWESLKEAWESGSWAVLGSFMTILQTQGYVYLLAMLVGATAVAEMNAARLFLSPLMVMSTGFSRVMIPRMALLKSDGKLDQAVKLAFKVLMVLGGMLVVYMVVVALGWSWIAQFMANKGYQNLWMLVMLWGVYFAANAMVNTPSELLQIFRQFRLLTLTGIGTSILVVLGSIPAITAYGIIGAIVVLIIGELGLATVLWNRFNFVRKMAG